MWTSTCSRLQPLRDVSCGQGTSDFTHWPTRWALPSLEWLGYTGLTEAELRILSYRSQPQRRYGGRYCVRAAARPWHEFWANDGRNLDLRLLGFVPASSNPKPCDALHRSEDCPMRAAR